MLFFWGEWIKILILLIILLFLSKTGDYKGFLISITIFAPFLGIARSLVTIVKNPKALSSCTVIILSDQ